MRLRDSSSNRVPAQNTREWQGNRQRVEVGDFEGRPDQQTNCVGPTSIGDKWMLSVEGPAVMDRHSGPYGQVGDEVASGRRTL